jgi:hypothetical protein
MHVEGAQAILANTKQDLCLVWDSNLELWGLVMGGHMEYIHPQELQQMDEVEFKVTVSNRMTRYGQSLKNAPDLFYKN